MYTVPATTATDAMRLSNLRLISPPDSLRNPLLLFRRVSLFRSEAIAESVRSLHCAHAELMFVGRSGRISRHDHFITILERVILDAGIGQLRGAWTFHSPTGFLSAIGDLYRNQ